MSPFPLCSWLPLSGMFFFGSSHLSDLTLNVSSKRGLCLLLYWNGSVSVFSDFSISSHWHSSYPVPYKTSLSWEMGLPSYKKYFVKYKWGNWIHTGSLTCPMTNSKKTVILNFHPGPLLPCYVVSKPHQYLPCRYSSILNPAKCLDGGRDVFASKIVHHFPFQAA
jgi:hypothetical protein